MSSEETIKDNETGAGFSVDDEIIAAVLNDKNDNEPIQEAEEQKQTARGVQLAEKTLTFIVGSLDSIAKDKGLPGLGDVTPSQYAELVVIVAEKHLSDEVLKHSPEAALVLLTAGILANNTLIYSRLKKEPKNDKKTKDADD